MHVRLIVLAIAATLPATAPAAPEQSTKSSFDPNEKVCENAPQIGSRLGKKRICATRAEWAARRLQDRQDAEYIQKGITTSTCSAAKVNGTPTC